MSSTGQASSFSNIQLIIDDALEDYTKITGINLAYNPFSAALEQSKSPEAILQVLQAREKEFKEYRDGDRRLISCLSPAVKILQAFSGIMGQAAGPIPFSPANVLFAGIDALLTAASGVTSSYDALLDLFECLGNFLQRLEVYTTMPPTPAMRDIIIKIMVQLLSVLALATKQIKEGRFKKFAKKLLGEREIEAILQRLDRLTQDEARMTVAETLGVVHGLVGSVRVVMEDGKASTDGILQNLVALHQVINEMNRMKRDQLRFDVQHWLSPPDPSTNHSILRKAQHKGTAAWFFKGKTLTEWKAKGSLLWIHGKPGAGKSTLLSAIVQDIERMQAAGLAMMAYYYFDFREVKKQDCYGLLSSLVSQLSAKSDSCFNILSQLYSENIRGSQKPDLDALQKCMTDMLTLPGQAPIYIIIDGPDECPNFPGRPSAREEVLELIEKLVNLKLPNVHLCTASRPEQDIRSMLEPLTSFNICLHDESGQREDMIEYIKYVVHSDRSMQRWKEEDKQLVIDTLSEKVDGMFRWVVCQVDRLCRTLPASIRIVLNDLPKTLDETYCRTLLGIDEEKREYAQRLFQCLLVSIRPLRVEELAEILAVQFDKAGTPTFNPAWRPESAEEAVTSVCSSLISTVDMGGSRVVQFSHFSVKEFLTSERLAAAEERLSYYHILPEPAHTILAHASLSVLLRLDENIDKEAIALFPFAPYAAQYWVNHAQFGNVSSHIQEVMGRLFDPGKPHFAAWVWLYDVDRHWIEPMSTICPTRPEAGPLYYASLCGFRGLVEHLIVAHSPDVNGRGGSHTCPLHAASFKRHLEVASLLIEKGADPNSRDHKGRAPLHRISRRGHVISLKIARLLVDSKANVNAMDDQGWTPLHTAARYGYREIAELLLEFDARVNVPSKTRSTPLHLSCLSGALDISRLLLERGSDINFQDKDGRISLHTASRFGHLDTARLLLGRGSDVNVLSTDLWTPLHYASNSGHLHVARFLIDNGADVNAHTADLSTPMHFASANGHLKVSKLLVERNSKFDDQNERGGTPLRYAVGNGHLDMARFLIDSGAAVTSRDNHGSTLLHKASCSGHLHITKFLKECDVKVDSRDQSEETSLHLASRKGKLDVARFLIEHGADIHAKNNEGLNPLHVASQNGRLDVVRMLIDAGLAVDIPSETKKTPLAMASSKGKVDVGRILIERGADINVRDNEGRAPLHIASEHGHLDMAQLLLDRDDDVNVRLDDLRSPLHLASANGHLKTADLLIQRGAIVDILNKKQETPLCLAATNGELAIARLLIDRGAKLRNADGNGCTVLHVASKGGHLEVVKLLLRRGADVKVLNKADKTAAELAAENDKAEVAKFIAEYKTDAKIQNPSRSNTFDTALYGTDEDGTEVVYDFLHAAAEDGNLDAVKSFLQRGIDVNSRDANNQTPLDRAAGKGKVDVVRLLVEGGAEVDSRDKWGWTPLHRASRYGHLEVSQVLIDHGANVDAMKNDHWTPMHLSAVYGHPGIVKLLLESGADVHALNGEGQAPYQVSLAFGRSREITELLLRVHGACSVSS